MSLLLDLVILILIYFISYILIGKYIEVVKKKYVQPLLEKGPDHKQKIGTPTMGGVSFISIFIIFIIIFAVLNYNTSMFDTNFYFIVILVTLIGYFFIGFKDDYDKVTKKQNDLGLSPKWKLILQALVSLVIIILLILNDHSTIIFIPLINISINFHIFYYIIVVVLLLATTNATNLTDGLDGLLTTNAIVSLIFLAIISFIQGNNIILISNIIFIVILLAFLRYNKNPAKIFMGDVGSLAIGGYLCIVAILLKVEVFFFFFSFIYFIETLSVILQVSYFKYTKRKYKEPKRLLLMAPLHHHYEKKGLSEKKIVLLFTSINICVSLIGMLVYCLPCFK